MALMEEHRFKSQGVTCVGRLHRLDETPANRPCVVMGHGFGATQDAGLQPFVDALVAADFAVFTFDYRHFGESEGQPRQLLVIRREIQDWLAAIDTARSLPGVDPERIALWGTSLGGGLATSAAARDGRVRALVAQCPMMDGMASAMAVLGYAGTGYMARLAGHGLLDLLRGAVGAAPHYIPSAGSPGQIAAMSAEDALDGYLSLMPEGAPNKVAARITTRLMFCRPGTGAQRVQWPALIQICDRDTVAPAEAAARAVRKMSDAEERHYDVGHFDIYHGQPRERVLADQIDFLKRHLQHP